MSEENDLDYAVVIGGLATFEIGMTVRVYFEKVLDGEYYKMADGERCDLMRAEYIRIITKEEFDALKPKNDFIRTFTSEMDRVL